jgi:methionine aminopeptidase
VAHFCGHGIGSIFHTTPNIIHVRNNEQGTMEVRVRGLWKGRPS